MEEPLAQHRTLDKSLNLSGNQFLLWKIKELEETILYFLLPFTGNICGFLLRPDYRGQEIQAEPT